LNRGGPVPSGYYGFDEQPQNRPLVCTQSEFGSGFSVASLYISYNSQRALVTVAFIYLMYFAYLTTKRGSESLQYYADDDPIFERRGQPPKYLSSLLKSWWKIFKTWFAQSRPIFGEFARVIFSGYVIPSTLFGILVLFWPWFFGRGSFFNLESPDPNWNCVPQASHVVMYVTHQLASAATFGAPEAFGWLEPQIQHDPHNLMGGFILWAFFVYIAWMGSVSLLKILGTLSWNLMAPCIFKLNGFVRRRMRMGLPKQKPEPAPAVLTVGAVEFEPT
jgi:hypothetical protein